MAYDKKIDAGIDFLKRKEAVIKQLDGVVIQITKNKVLRLNRELLEKEFVFDDAKLMYDKYDELITDGNFILCPTLKEVYIF